MNFQSDSDQNYFSSSPEGPTLPSQLPGPPQRERWRLRDLLFFILFIPVALVAANLLAFLGYAVLAPVFHWTMPLLKLRTNVVFLLALQLIFYVLLFAYIYLFIRFYYKASFFGALKWKSLSTHNVVRFLLAGIALSLVVMIIPPFLPQKKSFPLERMFNSPASAYAIAVFAIVIAPFMEELLFRGLLFAFFEKHGGMIFAIVSTALLFAGLHVPEYWGAWQNVLMILVVGFTLSIVRGMTGSVTPGYILHLAYNSTLMALLFVQTQHFHKMPAGFLFFH